MVTMGSAHCGHEHGTLDFAISAMEFHLGNQHFGARLRYPA